MRIINPNFQGFVHFDTNAYSTNLSAGTVSVVVARTVGSKGTATVQFSTANGTAIAGTDYVGATNTLQWNSGDVSPRIITLPLINSGTVGGSKQFTVNLSNPTLNGVSQASLLGAETSATVNIVNDNSYGIFQFTQPSYRVNEEGGYATITVTRTGGTNQQVIVNFATADGPTAFAPANYGATNGTLLFRAGDVAKSFTVPIHHDGVTDPSVEDFYFTVNLTGSSPSGVLGSPTTAVVHIQDSESYNRPPGDPDVTLVSSAGFNGNVLALGLESDGGIVAGGNFTTADNISRNYVARLNVNGSLDTGFLNELSGANGPVAALAVQGDDRIVIGGSFTFVDGIRRNYIARLNTDGSVDSSFNPNAGPDNPVYCVAESYLDGNRVIYLGGAFNFFNSTARHDVARLKANGNLDTTFNPPDIDGTVYAMAPYPTNSALAGKILIGGAFLHVQGENRAHIARLNADGSLDAGFNPGTGANATVRAITIQTDGQVLIGGSFTNYNGKAANHLARLSPGGSLDTAFAANLNGGANDTVYAIVLQPDNRIVLGGEFTRANGVTRNRITRLMPSGAVDPTINFGTGADSFVSSLAMQAGGEVILGGGFSTFNGEQHERIARVYGGSILGSGKFQFTSGNYQVGESGTNATVTVRRIGGTSGPNADGSGNITVHLATSNGSAVAGVNYGTVVTNLSFAPGEILQTINIPVFDDLTITTNLIANVALSNPTAPAGLGDQATATITILNTDSAIHFSSPVYSQNKNSPLPTAINLVRDGSTNSTSAVTFVTTTNGTGVAGVDYNSVSNVVVFDPGVAVVPVSVPVIQNNLPEGDRTVEMQLMDATNAVLADPSLATLTIVDTVQAPGQLRFSSTNYYGQEGTAFATVSVIRTNGSFGNVSVAYSTVPMTAVPDVNYHPVSGTITFAGGDTNKTFQIPLVENSIAQGPVTVGVVLSSPTGGATLASPTTAVVTILDNEISVAFSSPAYVASETNSRVTLNVLRYSGSNITTQVSYATTNGPAVANTNYVPVSGTLTFNPGEVQKSISVPLLHDPRATGSQTFGVNLMNPTAGAQLAFPSSANVILLDAEAGVRFTNSVARVLETATNLVVPVICMNPDVEPVTIGYSTSDGTAVAGVDYGAVSGTLVYTNGMATNYVTVPILDNLTVDGSRVFSLNLVAAEAPAAVVEPGSLAVTILDNDAGFKFGSPSYTVLKSGVEASIDVLRTGYLSNSVSVDFAALDGTATDGVDYFGTNGTFIFTNGETSKTFTVPVIDSTDVKPDLTVLLQLSNPLPGTNTTLVPPSAAVLTIHDNSGSLVVPAGSALISESAPNNGTIDPGETVTLLLGLRDSAGTNVANLSATMLAGGGVVSPSGTQNYGALPVNGPSVSRPFTFTANATNGQQIVATLELKDGAAVIGNAAFTFRIGTSSTSVTNGNVIVINDNTNATPYPSQIPVSNMGGSLSRISVTLSNVNHTWPSDIDALLVAPGGQKALLMANAGGGNRLQNVTLTFDDNAAAYLSQSGQIVSGTNRPSSYLPVAVFPASAPPAPYASNLAAFKGANPNGNWSLYILDDSAVNVGVISNGWSLNLTAANPVFGDSDLAVGMSGPVAPVVTGNDLTYTINVTNFGPATANGVVLTNTLPAGSTYGSSSGGTVALAGTNLVWSVGTLAKDATASLTVTVAASTPGTVGSTSRIRADQSDPYSGNNSASIGATVISPSADLTIGMSGTPNPVWLGNNITYRLYITNSGPAAADQVAVTNTLPPNVTLISGNPAGYIQTGNLVTFTNLGSLDIGEHTVLTLVVRPFVGGTITNSALVGSTVPDPLKGNNAASVKVIVQAPELAVSHSGNSLTITWPADAPGYQLESATSLIPPVVWTPVTSPAPTDLGGQKMITITIGSGSKYFRLNAAAP